MIQDFDLPPVERFTAEVLYGDQERDIALLKIETEYWSGGDVSIDFPHFEITTELPQLGEYLHIIGFPSIGSTSSRATLTLTRGITAGYQRVPFGTLIKTDGLISGGNSGGAAVNEDLQLVGLPSSVVFSDRASIGYIHPVSFLPSNWLQLIRD